MAGSTRFALWQLARLLLAEFRTGGLGSVEVESSERTPHEPPNAEKWGSVDQNRPTGAGPKTSSVVARSPDRATAWTEGLLVGPKALWLLD